MPVNIYHDDEIILVCRMPPPPKCPCPNLWNRWVCYMSWQKRNFAGVIKVTNHEIGDYPGLSGWAQSNPMSPQKLRPFCAWSQRDVAKGELGEIQSMKGAWPTVAAEGRGTQKTKQSMMQAASRGARTSKDQLTANKEMGPSVLQLGWAWEGAYFQSFQRETQLS